MRFLQIGQAKAPFEEVLESCIPILDESGVSYVVHRGGFTIDAEWNTAMAVIGKLHEHVHKNGYVRVHSDLRVGTRTDKAQTMQDKIDVVNQKLAK